MRNGLALLAGVSFVGVLLTLVGCGPEEGTPEGTSAVIQGTEPNRKGEATSAAPQSKEADPLHPVVEIKTTLGSVTVELDKERAPLTVENFLGYVESGYYQQTIFHQVLKDYVVLGGNFTVDFEEKKPLTPVATIRNEADIALKNRRGTIAMARRPDAIDSATSQFFFNVADNSVLDHKDRTVQGYGYCAFGKVTRGLEVIDKIAQVAVQDVEDFERTPVEKVLIESVKRIR
jgi:cyclophilin family peptidyl-prolyl cis-trans isomerase